MEKKALAPADWHTINKYLVGGAAVGGGLGLVTSLVNYLKTLKSESEEKSTQDDNTLFINVGNPGGVKSAAERGPSFFRGGLAMAGGALSSIGAYALVRKMYQELKKQQLQKELDESQQVYTGLLQQEADGLNNTKRVRRRVFQPQIKEAATAGEDLPMSGPEWAFSVPVALTLLMGVASGAITNQALKKAFPVNNKPSRLTPRRVVIRSNPSENDGAMESEEPPVQDYMPEKMAAYNDALEYLLDFTANMPGVGRDIPNMLKAAANGRYNEMLEATLNYGPDVMLDIVKGANMEKSASADALLQQQLATGLLAHSSTLGPVSAVLAAAEFDNAFPGLTKFASVLDLEVQDQLISVLAECRRAQRQDIFEGRVDGLYSTMDKQASLVDVAGQGALLERLLELGLPNGSGPPQHEDDESDGSSLLSTSGESSRPDIDVQGMQAGQFAADNKDLIDIALGAGKEREKPPYIVFAQENKEKQERPV